ncbi:MULTISPECIES: methyltransferase domain-containing protein [unclassified Akkermansia]|uniref:methyltransferase domain-containing protein n=1 Tax=unclassified Akkermansia TaxID=2608915 RepID=UPI000E9A3773|nr:MULTISPECIES: methyltransferase domain-containing protein [unclassified Akkermansia]HBN17701.1 SAM-dependent methyltransferase [Akkermansia sp.]
MAAFPHFHSVKGTAERTGLPGASVDLVTAAQSFHWFDAAAFKRECRRILSRGGRVALIWNSRVEDSPVVREEGDIHRLYCPRFDGFSGGLATLTDSIGAFFNHRFRVFRFPNDLSYTREQYLRRMMSASYALTEGGEERSSWLDALERLFDRFETEGRVTVPNETVVYLGSG